MFSVFFICYVVIGIALIPAFARTVMYSQMRSYSSLDPDFGVCVLLGVACALIWPFAWIAMWLMRWLREEHARKKAARTARPGSR